MNNSTTLVGYQKSILILAAVCLVISIFVPIWRIELSAPQYPEGLELLIYTNKVGGQFDIINGLNHYIGMKTIHKEDFVEFVALPYIIGMFALLTVLVAVLGKRKWLTALLIAFSLFGVLAMVDFWYWEYDYGHNLDPNAAIIVPGMSYQPPLIGYKQLLNFGAYSMPALGGYLFIVAGLAMVVAWFTSGRNKITGSLASMVLVLFTLSSCQSDGPQPIKYNKDECHACKMTINDKKFACQIISTKGRAYNFDDLHCLIQYANGIEKSNIGKMYCANYLKEGQLTDMDSLFYVKSDKVKSPMNGQIAAFKSNEEANKQALLWQGEILNVKQLFK